MTDARAHLVRSWLGKARGDLMAARALAAYDPPLLETAVYHCQQAAEKAIKGYLVFCDHEVLRIHDIEVLVRTAMLYAPGFEGWIDAGVELTPYARIYRYPGDATEPTQAQFDRAFTSAEGLTTYVRSLLPPAMQEE